MTAAQREAVEADDRVVCVLAGAGAGKTRVLTLRVARRCDDASATPEHTLVCTFSRKAADELRDRLRRLGVFGVTAGTIHRIALRILRDWRDHARMPPPVVLGDRQRVLEAVLASSGPAVQPFVARHLDIEIGWAKARLAGPGDYEALARQVERTVRLPLGFTAQSFAAYEAERRRRSLLDLDDLLTESARVLEEDDGFAGALRWRFRHLYVDELQDVNAAQFRLLRVLGGLDPDLFCVGDPNQSIYGWNGADPDLLAHLPRVFPDARVIRLDANHRSSPAIVRLASAALEVTEAPTSTRADGPVPVIVEHETDVEEAQWVARRAWLSHGPGRRWSKLAVLARTNAQLRTIARALEQQKIPFSFASGDLGPASDLGSPSDDGTLGEPETVDTATWVSDAEHIDGVVLSTFHRAKGLQWPCVVVIGLGEGLVPIASARSEAAIAEERRLLYVALTRAEDELWCSWARGTSTGSTTAGRQPCRWLAAIERERVVLENEHGPAEPASVAEHLANLRSIVSRAGGVDRADHTEIRPGRPAPR